MCRNINIYWIVTRKEGKCLRLWCLKWEQFITFVDPQEGFFLDTENNGAPSFSVPALIRKNSSYNEQRFLQAICVNRQLKYIT